MPTAYLTTRGVKASIIDERLHLEAAYESAKAVLPSPRDIPLHDIEHLVIDEGIHCSTFAICQLLKRNIPILLLSNRNLPAGYILPLNTATRVLASQLDTSRDPQHRLRLSRLYLRAKIINQKRVLQRLAANRKQPMPVAQFLDSLAQHAQRAATIDSLLGIEGAASGKYFETLATFFPTALPFERRSRRPPHNPPNALLSFLYTLLASELALHLRATALEPGWGFLHEPEDNRPSLALDLLEPFRAPVADALTLDLLNHRRLTADDFETIDDGCFLRRDSRRKLFTAYEDRMEREFHYDLAGHRTTLRSILKDQCQQIKRYFRQHQPDPQPFIMN